jgi:hypothetical protein
MLQDYPDLKNHRTIKTKNGFHVYCKYDESVKTTTGALVNYNKIDIRNDDAILFASPMSYKLQNGSWAKYVDLGGDILPIPDIILRNLKQNNTPNCSVKSSSVPVTSTKQAISHQTDKIVRDDNDVIPIGMNDDYILMWNCISQVCWMVKRSQILKAGIIGVMLDLLLNIQVKMKIIINYLINLVNEIKINMNLKLQKCSGKASSKPTKTKKPLQYHREKVYLFKKWAI